MFLATNRPFDLDEAMHRRITSVVEFKSPDHIQRRAIWQIMIQSNGVRVEDGIDWEQVALKYELSGGFIKNAVMSAMLQALGRDCEAPVLKECDIVQGCRAQMRGSLQVCWFYFLRFTHAMLNTRHPTDEDLRAPRRTDRWL